MTRLESIARDLAAVLSPEGEGDWRRFTDMADDVGTQLYEQLETAFPAPAGRPAPLAYCAGRRRGGLRPSA